MESWKKFKTVHRETMDAYKLLSIPLAIWAVFFMFAIIKAFGISLTDWNLLKEPMFIGIDNYKEVLCDKEATQAFMNTGIWTLCMAVGQNVIGLAIAMMLNAIPRGEKLFKALLFWPIMVSAVVEAQMIKYIFDPSPFGFANSILQTLGMPSNGWYQDPKMALFSLMVFPMITGFGIKMLIYQAGLNSLPQTVYEAAEIDGATKVQQFIRITLPLLKPIIVLNFVMSTIEGFRILAPMQLVTDGGPINSTSSVVLSIYTHGFVYNNMGYACAMAFVLFGIVLILSMLQLKLQDEDIGYE